MVIEHIEKSWLVYRKNFCPLTTAIFLQLLIVGILLLIAIAPWIFILLSFRGSNIMTLLWYNMGVLFFSVIFFAVSTILSVVLNGGFVKMLYESFRGKTRFETMLKTAREKFWTILGANSLFLLIFLLILGALLVPIASLMSFSFSQGVSMLYLFVIILTIILGAVVFGMVSVLFIFVNQAIVIDNLKAVPAIKKSYEVAKKSFLTILGIMVIFILINIALTTVFSFIGSILEWFVTQPLILLSYTSVYLERRRKK